MRYRDANNFTGAPLPGYEAGRALLRGEAAAALGRVQGRLRSKGLGLRVFDAYRPVRASEAMVAWAQANYAGIEFEFPLFPGEMLRHVPPMPKKMPSKP